jgi:tetratricopeptide (TPR) repeat protein
VSGNHYEDFELLAYDEANSHVVDLSIIATHLSSCTECTARLTNVRQFMTLLADKSIHALAARPARRPLGRHLQDAATRVLRATSDDRQTEPTFADLLARPIETWTAYLQAHPSLQTAGIVRRLVAEAREEFDRRADHALLILDVAAEVARTFTDADARAEHHASVEKERANALRMLGRYSEAFDALDAAEGLLASLPSPAYDLTFVRWGRATLLFYATRYAESLPLAHDVVRAFLKFGETEYARQAEVLVANILCEQGNVANAHAMYSRLLSYFTSRDTELVARLHANLAECEVRLDHPDAARSFAAEAMRGYDRLNKPSEKIRVRWTLGYLLLRQQYITDAREELQHAIAEFESLGMVATAGTAGLDLAELHILQQEWDDAERLARRLVALFTEADAPLHTTRALAFLRDATASRTATVDLLDYLRSYLEHGRADDPFAPPEPPATRAQ